MKILGAQI